MAETRLILGDCLEALKTLASGSVDAVVTDPPYGIGFKYATHQDSPEGYGEWLWSILLECERLCTPGSPLFVWQATQNARRFAEWFPREWRLFISARNFTQMNRDPMPHSYEPVVCWWTPGERWVSEPGQGIGVPRDWHVADAAGGLRRNKLSGASQHPCPRQLDAVEYLVSNWVKPGGLVLDPFAGSGTTAVACIRTGRRFVGMEIDPTYYKIAERRIAEAQGMGSLFDDRPAPKPLFADAVP